VSAIEGNAGAGGVAMALAADHVMVRDGSVLNMHYKNLGLYGSEYWTYSLPKRVGSDMAKQLTETCPPLIGQQALQIGLSDLSIQNKEVFLDKVHEEV